PLPLPRVRSRSWCGVSARAPTPTTPPRRNADAKPGHRYLPYALGDGRVRRFYECQNPLTSSLYHPNDAMLAKFSCISLPVVAEHDIQTHRLDDLTEIQDIDYLKLDVQGAELDIILGGPRLLQGTVLVHTQVEFIPMYTDQPLFGDIDVALPKPGPWLPQP